MTQAFDPRAIAARRVNATIGDTLLRMRTVDGAPELAKTRPGTLVRLVRRSPTPEPELLVEEAIAGASPPAPSQVRLVDDAAPALTSEQREQRRQQRRRRHREVRSKSISVKRLPKAEIDLGRALYPDEGERRLPLTRGDCLDGPRPCPLVSCVHNLYLDVSPATGAIKKNFPDLDVDEMVDSCALDVADKGGETLERVGEIMNVTRERIRQVEVKALAKLEDLKELTGFVDGDSRRGDGKRRLPILVGYLDEDLDDDGADEALAAEE